ncbi:MAG: D-tyrosyl-tRNA(Tyr) deacylase [Pseudomonadota bacterium]
MLAVVQRVRQARVEVDSVVVGDIGHGLLAFVCAQPLDTPDTAKKFLDKVLRLRVFADEHGKMNLSLQDVQGGLLLVSQFTLAADVSRGTRPGFSGAAAPAMAREWFEQLVRMAQSAHPQVAAGVFAADMQVHLINDGPVTIPIQM